MSFQVSGMRRVAAILKARGIRVAEVEGWTTRGHSTFAPRAVVCHWTAAGRSVTSLLVHGRPGIPGPLCNFEVLPGSDGVKLVAAGKANHAGVARSGFTNSITFGIEAAGPPISSEEFRVYQALVAAICKVYGLPVGDRVRDHREVALPFGRKVDISSQYDMGSSGGGSRGCTPARRWRCNAAPSAGTASPGTRDRGRSACTAGRAAPARSSP